MLLIRKRRERERERRERERNIQRERIDDTTMPGEREQENKKKKKRECDKEINSTLIHKPNFLTLLNIPDQLEQFGAIRSVWEGGEMGEGSIKALKQKNSRLNGKWALCALNSYYEDQSMISLIHECIGNITNNFSKPFANNANLDRLRTSFNGEKSNNTTELAEERSIPKRRAHPTDSKDKLIGYVPDSPLLNDNIKASYQDGTGYVYE